MTRVVLQVRVRPNARVSELQAPQADGQPWTARLKSPPVDGKANAELVALVAAHLGCARKAVSIKAGASGRLKLVQVEG